MNKLTKVERVFVPINVNNELSPAMVSVSTINNKSKLSIHQRVTEKEYQNDLSTFKEMYDKNGYLNFGDNSIEVTHWLKEQNNKYLLSEEDIVKLISDAFDDSREHICIKSFSKNEIKFVYKKEQYIKQILNKQ